MNIGESSKLNTNPEDTPYIDKHGSIKRGDVIDLCHVTQDQAYKLLSRLKNRCEIVQGAITGEGSAEEPMSMTGVNR